VEAGDIAGARRAVQRLMDDASLRTRLAENGRKTAEQWCWDPSIDLLEKIYFPGKMM
jgi:hypothetical protein